MNEGKAIKASELISKIQSCKDDLSSLKKVSDSEFRIGVTASTSIYPLYLSSISNKEIIKKIRIEISSKLKLLEEELDEL